MLTNAYFWFKSLIPAKKTFSGYWWRHSGAALPLVDISWSFCLHDTETGPLWSQTIIFFSSGDPPQSNSMMLWYTYLTFFIRASLNSPLIFFFFLLKQNYKIIFLTTNLYKLDGDDFLKMIYIKHVLWLWSLSILCKLDQLSFHAFLM